MIVPTSEQGCYSPEKFEKIDSLAYKSLQIHAQYVEKHIHVAKKLTENADPDVILETLSTTSGNVLAFGHGFDHLITANNCQAWLTTSQLQHYKDIIKDRVFIFVACLTGKKLCKELVKHGAKASFGLKDVGLVIVVRGAKYCRYLYAPLIGLLETAIAISHGFTPKKAYEMGKKRWENEIHYWSNFYYHEKIKTEYSDIDVDEDLAQLLLTVMTHNYNAFVYYSVEEEEEREEEEKEGEEEKREEEREEEEKIRKATAKDIIAMGVGMMLTMGIPLMLQQKPTQTSKKDKE